MFTPLWLGMRPSGMLLIISRDIFLVSVIINNLDRLCFGLAFLYDVVLLLFGIGQASLSRKLACFLL